MGDVVAVTASDGRHAVKVADPGLTADLEGAKIPFAGQLENKWLSTPRAWVAPVVFFIAICSFAMKRMGGAHGMMEIGKAKVDLVAADVSRAGSHRVRVRVRVRGHSMTRMHSAVCSVGHMLHRRLRYRRSFSCSTAASCTAQRRSR